ncbi:hypothetical protein JHS3_22500 [Jeongeupia sp. HS-3]|uniref:hypothetical protein n=1 Tax=Jeongeupia sp. HS-3 TaxID=1009682 RepID=UPI0018A3BC34|nr:hypothetical protein [Jeongeupia sp. HS-3]BCL76514.1 hypothetical protein JHS3_22500 [Jeongeupia sp. HS-3]
MNKPSNLPYRPVFDGEAYAFLEGFNAPGNPLIDYWLPRYAETLGQVRTAIAQNDSDTLFKLVWRTVDNAVSNAGQGVIAFDVVDRLRDQLVDITCEVGKSGSDDNFKTLESTLTGWRSDGQLPKVPRLLLARAFAAIHPDLYHTTVDEGKQQRVIPWFVRHTGFVEPEGNWATKAAALTAHLDRCGVFAGDTLRRNLFPWYVFDQLRDANGKLPFRAGHRPHSAPQLSGQRTPIRSVSQRHNDIQNQLYRQLCAQPDAGSVATEHATGTGGRADALVLRCDGHYDLYEIKPAATAAEAVRQAMGQLLEYGYRRGGLNPASLYVVSDAPLDEVTQEYLQKLHTLFGLKLEYLQVTVGSAKKNEE